MNRSNALDDSSFTGLNLGDRFFKGVSNQDMQRSTQNGGIALPTASSLFQLPKLGIPSCYVRNRGSLR